MGPVSSGLTLPTLSSPAATRSCARRSQRRFPRERAGGGAHSCTAASPIADAVQDLFARVRFTHVYHLAAYAAEGLSHFIKRFNYTNNVIGSVNLINASVMSGVELFVFASSIAVYGAGPELPLTEGAPLHPEDSYGIAKYAIELELRACRTMFGLDSIVFRPHNVFGPRQNISDRYRNVIGIFMNQILQGQPMTIFGDGTQTRAFSYVADVAPLMAEAMDVAAARNQVFNIGADVPCSLNDLALAVAAAMRVTGRRGPPRAASRGAARALGARQDTHASSATGRRRHCRTGSRRWPTGSAATARARACRSPASKS